LKYLTEVLIGLGLKLNTGKTTGSLHVVASSLKADKLAWIRGRQNDQNLQKHLLVIHAHGLAYPNAGSLIAPLTRFHKRLSKHKNVHNPVVLISIAVDIAYTSPRVFPVCAAIISLLLEQLKEKKDRVDVIEKIHRKLSQMPNTGHMEVWLQRIGYSYAPKAGYQESLCQLVQGNTVTVWNNDWITSPNLKSAIDPTKIINTKKLKSLQPVIKPKEIALFELLGEIEGLLTTSHALHAPRECTFLGFSD
jgi:RNA-directed DNA polymerase